MMTLDRTRPGVAALAIGIADSAMGFATDAVRVYGGYGFVKEDIVEKVMRDAKIMQRDEDTSQMKRLVIARATLLPRHVGQPAAG